MEPLEIRKQIIEELNKPGFADITRQIGGEINRRQVIRHKPTILTWMPNRADPVSFGLKPPEGSITLFWAPRTSRLLKDLECAYLTRDIESLESIHKRVVPELTSRSITPVEKAANLLVQSDSVFDFTYNGKALSRALFLANRAEFFTLVYAYNGGPLNRNLFEIVEFVKHREEHVYDCLVVIAPPELSDIEKAALEATSVHGFDDFPLAAPPLCFAICAIVTVVLFTVVFTAATTCCDAAYERLARIHLSDDMIKRLGARASARELLHMRQEVLEDYAIMI